MAAMTRNAPNFQPEGTWSRRRRAGPAQPEYRSSRPSDSATQRSTPIFDTAYTLTTSGLPRNPLGLMSKKTMSTQNTIRFWNVEEI